MQMHYKITTSYLRPVPFLLCKASQKQKLSLDYWAAIFYRQIRKNLHMGLVHFCFPFEIDCKLWGFQRRSTSLLGFYRQLSLKAPQSLACVWSKQQKWLPVEKVQVQEERLLGSVVFLCCIIFKNKLKQQNLVIHLFFFHALKWGSLPKKYFYKCPL